QQDYDDWAAAGATGWRFADVLPYFLRAEGNQRLGAPLHGQDGPLTVSDGTHRHPLSLAFVKAAMEAGVPYTEDFNGTHQEGVGYYQTTTEAGR
ncbi:GMC family oxidoreductase N-terminal domain-containing protein, partial [Burkholderia sp. SIMBA_062]